MLMMRSGRIILCKWIIKSINIIIISYERCQTLDGYIYSIVGYATVYSFYAYPDKLRPKIRLVILFCNNFTLSV